MTFKNATLRCNDNAEACVFTRYDYKPIMNLPDGVVKRDTDYEIVGYVEKFLTSPM